MTQAEDDATKLLELEERIAAQAGGPFNQVMVRLVALLEQLWPGDDAPAEAKTAVLDQLNLGWLLSPVDGAVETIAEGVVEASEMGIEAASAQQGRDPRDYLKLFKRQAAKETLTQVGAIQGKMDAQVRAGEQLLRQASTKESALTAMVSANPGPSIVRHARTLTNQASNEAIIKVAEVSPQDELIWIAERDACVHCLAYQGAVRVSGKYPKGLTFGAKSYSDAQVKHPPLHPNCRCTQRLVPRESAPDIIVGLKREAQRSVLRGWSVPSESNGVRIDAARRLLAKNPTMPKSVKAYARKALKDGEFQRGRDFPG